MRILVALMLGLFLAATAFAASGTATRRPSLAVARGTVHGTHFAARERVRVRFLVAGKRTARQTRASASGNFATRLPYQDPCLGTIVVTARGATGDGARLKLPQRACAPAD